MTSLLLSMMMVIGLRPVASPIDGRWQATHAELAGKAFPENVTKTLVLTLKDDYYDLRGDKGTVTLLTDGKMEIIGTVGPNKGKTYKAIYERKGDVLTICYDLSGTNFPTAFSTEPNTKLLLVKYSLT